MSPEEHAVRQLVAMSVVEGDIPARTVRLDWPGLETLWFRWKDRGRTNWNGSGLTLRFSSEEIYDVEIDVVRRPTRGSLEDRKEIQA